MNAHCLPAELRSCFLLTNIYISRLLINFKKNSGRALEKIFSFHFTLVKVEKESFDKTSAEKMTFYITHNEDSL